MKNVKIAVDGVIIRNGHIKCLWHGSPGFGELDIYSNRNDPMDSEYTPYEDETCSFEVTTEHMGKDFYRLVLEEMIKYLEEKSDVIS